MVDAPEKLKSFFNICVGCQVGKDSQEWYFLEVIESPTVTLNEIKLNSNNFLDYVLLISLF
jgi:hypothetical protein